MKLSQSFGLFIFYHPAISFSYSSSLYIIWSWVGGFAYSFFIIQLFLFPTFQLHIIYEVESMVLLIHFLSSSYFFFVPFIFILYGKLSRCSCIFSYYHSRFFVVLSLYFSLNRILFFVYVFVWYLWYNHVVSFYQINK